MKENRSVKQNRMILVLCCCIQAGANGILVNCAGLFFQAVAGELNITIGQISFYLTLSNLSSVLFLPYAGKLLERLPVGKVLFTAASSASVSFIAMSCYRFAGLWYLSGVVIGISGAFLYYLAVPELIVRYYKGRKNTAIGIAASSAGISGTVFNLLGASCIQKCGWRIGYRMLGSFSLLLMVPAIYVILFRCKITDERELKYENEKRNRQFKNWLPYFFVGSGIALAASCNSHLTSYGISEGFTEQIGSLLMSLSMVGNVFLKCLFGFLSDRAGVYKTFFLYLIMAVLALIGILSLENSLLAACGGAFLYGSLLAMTAVGMPVLIRENCKEIGYGRVFSKVSAGMGLFGAVGVSFIGFIYDLSGSYRLGWEGCIVVLAVTGAILYAIMRGNNNPETQL